MTASVSSIAMNKSDLFAHAQRPSEGHFADLIAPRDAATDRTPPTKGDQARQAAQALVATTFIRPLLAQVREDPFRSDLFHGGFAEDAFGGQLDSIIADQVTKATRLPIVEAVYNRTMTVGTRMNTHG